MRKQKAKIYKGKRIVMGNKNLVTKNEIHVNDIPQQGGESNGGNSGGGTQLEGEYFLAKPNGRYWKFTFSPDKHYIDLYSLSKEQLEALMTFYGEIAPLGVIYGAAVCNADSPMDEALRVDGVGAIGVRVGIMQNILREMLYGSHMVDASPFNSSFFRVWKECDIKSNPPVEIPNVVGLSLNSYNLVEFIKMIYAMEERELTDDETISIIEQMLMLIPATEEEYKEARREN